MEQYLTNVFKMFHICWGLFRIDREKKTIRDCNLPYIPHFRPPLFHHTHTADDKTRAKSYMHLCQRTQLFLELHSYQTYEKYSRNIAEYSRNIAEYSKNTAEHARKAA